MAATTKAVGKRRRSKTGSTKGELELFYSLIPEQHGRTICFRAARSSALAIDFYCIPVDDDDDSPQPSYGAPPKRILPIYSSTNISGSSSFAAVDKSMYCVGGHKTNGKGEETSAIYRFDTTGDNSGSWFRNSFDMRCPRVAPSTVVMDGKIFVIGTQVVSEGAPPLVEVFDPSSKYSLIVVSPPPPESIRESMLFAFVIAFVIPVVFSAATAADSAMSLVVVGSRLYVHKAPAPGPDAGAAFSLPVSTAIVASSLIISLLALLRH
ncbi:hypothetical protein RHGRI_006310 [Rhododendron griersonianum]|uniref:Uncharacterized protein n=1 Tax=Rhododendron griersonianum TaxID=479676 RepID=A0AAV6KTN2_9ERIC|nr:hypothetical protein RHGRI_006310 [Rhododendron griersonianum]